MAKRFKLSPQEITNTEAWDTEAQYIALDVNNLMMTFGPELIVLGGGLTHHTGLLANIRSKIQQNINN
jgi:predicted NBD/HSP70 family sugar kinase